MPGELLQVACTTPVGAKGNDDDDDDDGDDDGPGSGCLESSCRWPVLLQ